MVDRLAYSVGNPTIWHGHARTEKALGPAAGIALTATDLVAGNRVMLFRAPANFVVTGFRLDVPKLDSNGTPALVFNLGDTSLATRFLSASTSGQNGAVAVPLVAGAVGYRFPTDADVILTTTTSAATAAPGTLFAFLFGFLEP